MKTRLLTAAIISLCVIYVLSFCPVQFAPFALLALIVLSVFLAGTEFAALRWNFAPDPALPQQKKPLLRIPHAGIGLTYGMTLVIYFIAEQVFSIDADKQIALSLAWVFFCFLVMAFFLYSKASDMALASHRLFNVLSGFLYLVFPTICLLKLISFADKGLLHNGAIYFSIAIIVMGDSGAFFIGTRFGKKKLMPKVSPNKSVEGSLGGLFLSVVTAICLNFVFELGLPCWLAVVIGLCAGIAGQMGDLIESALKRASGFKDSGNLLPGHGGFLDRIDSLILGIPVVYFFFELYF